MQHITISTIKSIENLFEFILIIRFVLILSIPSLPEERAAGCLRGWPVQAGGDQVLPPGQPDQDPSPGRARHCQQVSLATFVLAGVGANFFLNPEAIEFLI